LKDIIDSDNVLHMASLSETSHRVCGHGICNLLSASHQSLALCCRDHMKLTSIIDSDNVYHMTLYETSAKYAATGFLHVFTSFAPRVLHFALQEEHCSIITNKGRSRPMLVMTLHCVRGHGFCAASTCVSAFAMERRQGCRLRLSPDAFRIAKL